MKSVWCLILVVFVGLLASADLDSQLDEAEKLYREGQYKEAASILEACIDTYDVTIEIMYDATCCFALSGDKEKAFECLNRCVELGWLDYEWPSEDSDLETLWSDPEWKTVMVKIEANREKLLNVLPQAHELKNPIALPEPSHTSETSIEEALLNRRSVRQFTDESLSVNEVSQLLWAAYGVTKRYAPKKLRGGMKTAPSAGALYPLELYLAAWNVQGLDPGIYIYEPDGHMLYPVKEGDFHEELGTACLDQDWVTNAPASIIWSAVYERTTSKYGSRGRARYVPMDLGHSAENVYLQVQSMGMGTVAIGAFDDLQLQILTGMTREEEPLYVMPLGKVK